mgnify:FL=1
MTKEYDHLKELYTPLSLQEFSLFEKLYNEDNSSKQLKFNYAWALIRTDSKELQIKGVNLLTAIFKTTPERRKQSLYFLSLGNYKLKNYELSLKYLDALINAEKDLGKHHDNLDQLKLMIQDDVRRTTGTALLGIGVGVGLLAVGISVINRIWGSNNNNANRA